MNAANDRGPPRYIFERVIDFCKIAEKLGIDEYTVRELALMHEKEISEEISTWKDLGTLGKKANQFKPKLDKMQQEVVEYQLQQQEAFKQQQEEAAHQFMYNVDNTLKDGQLNGVKLDKKTQAFLFTELTQPKYQSLQGRNTNLLGHLLERYQFVEPRYDLIAEALWLLEDPDGYKKTCWDPVG